MAMEHDYFGLVGDYWSERIEYADQSVEVVLDADEEGIAAASLDAAASLVGELEFVDDEIRGVFVGQLDDRTSAVLAYLRTMLDPELEQADEIEAAIGRDSGDHDVDALRSLSLVRVDLRPEADGDGEPFAEFEYALAPEDTDERLVAVIDLARTMVDIRFEG